MRISPDDLRDALKSGLSIRINQRERLDRPVNVLKVELLFAGEVISHDEVELTQPHNP